MEERRTRVLALGEHVDERGHLFIVEGNESIPFKIKRVFWINGVSTQATRGGHAHKKCRQAIFAANGSLWASVSNGRGDVANWKLQGNIGVLVEPGEFVTLYSFSNDAVAVVFCSEHYDEADIEKAEYTVYFPYTVTTTAG